MAIKRGKDLIIVIEDGDAERFKSIATLGAKVSSSNSGSRQDAGVDNSSCYTFRHFTGSDEPKFEGIGRNWCCRHFSRWLSLLRRLAVRLMVFLRGLD